MADITPSRYISETEMEVTVPSLSPGSYSIDVTNDSGTGSETFTINATAINENINVSETIIKVESINLQNIINTSNIFINTSVSFIDVILNDITVINNIGINIDTNTSNILINTLDQWAGVTKDDCSVASNTFFNFNSDCYNNEKLLYDKITSEAYDQHGVKGDWYAVDYSLNNEKLFGEDNDKHILYNFPLKVYMELPFEQKQYNQWGMEELDNFLIYCNKYQYELYAKRSGHSGYIPREGDFFRPHYNGVIYEVINVRDSEEQFLNTQHTWKFTLRVFKNEMLTTSPNVSAERLTTYDETNAVPTEPPTQLQPISAYTTSGSDTLKQNDLIDDIKNDVLYEDPNDPNHDPFGGW